MQLSDDGKEVLSAKYFPPLSNNTLMHSTDASISAAVTHLILRKPKV